MTAEPTEVPVIGPHSGLSLIAAERIRQITGEGFGRERDAAYTRGELVRAAYSYMLASRIPMVIQPGETAPLGPPNTWPWDQSWWKPSTPIRDLEKAGALIAAEIDRLLAEAGGSTNADVPPPEVK